MILGRRAIHGFSGSDAVWVIGIGNRVITMREGGKPPAVLPGELIALSVDSGSFNSILECLRKSPGLNPRDFLHSSQTYFFHNT